MIEALLMSGKKPVGINDLFSTTTYSGVGGPQSVETGIDLANNDGLVWIKQTTSRFESFIRNAIFDTKRLPGYSLYTTNISASNQNSGGQELNSAGFSFNSSGFSLSSSSYDINGSGYDFAAWSFRAHPDFLDVIKYTGNGVDGRLLKHSLNYPAAYVFIKNITDQTYWSAGYFYNFNNTMFLNRDSPRKSLTTERPNGYGIGVNTLSQDEIRLISQATDLNAVNASGKEYIAYVFPTGNADSYSRTGTYNGGGATPVTVTTGWPPQFVMIKKTLVTGDWLMFDDVRGFDKYVAANSAIYERDFNNPVITKTATGFQVSGNANDATQYTYLAIRGEL